jgi:hypothetical protein
MSPLLDNNGNRYASEGDEAELDDLQALDD